MPISTERTSGVWTMRVFAWTICMVIICATAGADAASAQQSTKSCSSEQQPGAAQTLRCRDGLIIVAEDGAKFTLHSKGGNVDGVDLQSKAVLVDAPKQKGKSFQVITPQAIAAVRGTKWAVDAQGSRTSGLVLAGQGAGSRLCSAAAEVWTSSRAPSRWW